MTSDPLEPKGSETFVGRTIDGQTYEVKISATSPYEEMQHYAREAGLAYGQELLMEQEGTDWPEIPPDKLYKPPSDEAEALVSAILKGAERVESIRCSIPEGLTWDVQVCITNGDEIDRIARAAGDLVGQWMLLLDEIRRDGRVATAQHFTTEAEAAEGVPIHPTLCTVILGKARMRPQLVSG